MRQTHQKSRSRGRNRKPQNPMSRNYESNGPDVKIRGNAAHVAEKYTTLSRDALSNGDTVMAESYLQHAEHYNRIVAAAQAQKAEENNAAANGRAQQQDNGENNAETPAAEATAEANAEAAAGGADGNKEQSGEPKERKNGRGRRTKRVSAEANGNGNGMSEKSAEEQPKADDIEKVAVEVEVISDDAASLPSSITGGLQAEEG